MSHIPTEADAAADLYRCVYFSLQKDGFSSSNFIDFFNNAQKILSNLNSKKARLAKQLIIKFKDETKPTIKRQEDLLTASILLK